MSCALWSTTKTTGVDNGLKGTFQQEKKTGNKNCNSENKPVSRFSKITDTIQKFTIEI